ncbi:hypothetical protein Nepgr_025796 [Nepenthes gracilis]|uniref:DEP domain-containing protein n=1 Tax=Nepenthes gracilis TaxID=150966 RepID=A0AAD3Y008_NEPGR|nr:hypothetical protein Nepgr_025796 [Nepenthes gracilis]
MLQVIAESRTIDRETEILEGSRMGEKFDGGIICDQENSSVSEKDFTESSADESSNSYVEVDIDEATDIEIDKGEMVKENRDSECSMAEVSGEHQISEPAVGDDTEDVSPTRTEDVGVVHPHENLPKPVAPGGLLKSYSTGDVWPRQEKLSANFSIDVPSIGRFIRERSSRLSEAIAKRLNLEEDSSVTVFTVPGTRVIVRQRQKNEEGHLTYDASKDDIVPLLKGRVTFFSRSNCRDCRAVRSFLREIGLKYVEINVDVFPMRERELIERAGVSTVPQIFFNEKHVGGLVALNSLRNSGLLHQTLKTMLSPKCPDDAPAPPAYGFDDPEVEQTDEMAGIVAVLRQRMPIQDRLVRLRVVGNCFTGSDLVEVLIRHLDCGHDTAIEIGKELQRKHFIHHVFGENDFQDGNKTYRFLEHEPFIPKCFNFRGSVDDSVPKSAAAINQRLTKIMSAILESYASEDRHHVDYASINSSEEFRRYLNLVQGLHRVDIKMLSSNEKLAFFLNIHNAMAIHAMIKMGYPEGMIERKPLVTDFQYLIGGHSYSLSAIKNGILRSNRRPPYSLIKPFAAGDTRLKLVLPAVNPLIHFGLCDGTRSAPTVRFFTSQNVEAELRGATREFFQRGGLEVDLAKRTVYLTRIIKWFNVDFSSSDRETLKWLMNYVDASKAGLLTHLLSDGAVNIVYQNYNWSANF